jgi:hypothetical protein
VRYTDNPEGEGFWMELGIISTLRPGLPLNTDALDRLQAIDKHDFTQTLAVCVRDRTLKQKNTDKHHMQGMLFALKQYYALPVLDPFNMHAVSDEVDDLWHAHMLCSKDYTGFCEKVIGYFMHHEPLDKDNFRAVAHVRAQYDYTIECLSKWFTNVSEVFWPRSVSDTRLICVHFGTSIKNASTSIRDRAIVQPDLRYQPLEAMPLSSLSI